jgi:hypothetical protein
MKNINLQEAEEQLKRVLLMMKYDSGKTLTENKISILERDMVVSSNGDLQSLKSLLTQYKLNPTLTTGDQHPRKKQILARFSNYNILTVTTPIGIFDFYQFKPEGFWSQQNIVLQTFQNKSRIGTFDVNSEKLFMKNWDTPISDWYKDNDFNDVIKIDNLKSTKEEPKKEEGNKKEPIKRTYVACLGTVDQPFKKLCYEKDPNGPLHKVQGCLGLTADGKFWEKTEKALIKKTGKPTFTISDVDTICKSSQQTPEQTEVNPLYGEVSLETKTGEVTASKSSAPEETPET